MSPASFSSSFSLLVPDMDRQWQASVVGQGDSGTGGDGDMGTAGRVWEGKGKREMLVMA